MTTLTIGQATPTFALNSVIVTYNGQGRAVAANVLGVNGSVLGAATISYSLNSTPLAPGVLPTDAGLYTVTASFAGNTDYASTSTTNMLTIGQATPTIALSPVNVLYDGNSHGVVTANVFGVNGNNLGTATVSYSTMTGAAPVSPGTYTATATFTSTNTDYTNATATTMIFIDQAAPGIALTPVTVTYTGSPQYVPSPSVFSADGTNLGTATISYTLNGKSVASPTDAGLYVVTASFAGDANDAATSVTARWTITPATPTLSTLSPISVIYDAAAHGITAEVYGVNHTDLGAASISYNGSPWASAPVSVGAYTATASFAGSQDYTAVSATTTVVIYPIGSLVTPVITLSPVSVTYDGNPHGTSAEVYGADGVDLGAATISYSLNGMPAASPTAAGVYTVTAKYAGDPNDRSTTVTSTLTIAPATPTIATLSPVSVAYDGNAQSVTAPGVTGLNAANLGTATISYSLNGMPVASPTDAGTYTVTASFTSTNPDYASIAAGTYTTTLTITPATPTIATLSPITVTYDGNMHGITAPGVTGVNSNNLGTATITYSLNGTPLAGSAKPVNAGAYTATAAYTSSNPDYTGATATTTILIYPQTSGSTVTPIIALFPASATYTGQPITASAQVYGSTGTNLGAAMISYSLNGMPVASPVDAGTYTVTASFAAITGYSMASATSTLTITPATPTLSTLSPVSLTYDGNPHGVTAPSVIGVNGAIGSATISYSLNGMPVASPLDAGVYTVTASFTSTNPDYNSIAAGAYTTTLTIAQAAPTLSTLSPVSLTYDANPHGVTAPGVTGLNSENLGSATITYSLNGTALAAGAVPTQPGYYTATASFAGTQDYSAATATTTILIFPQKGSTVLTPVIALFPVIATYDGNADAATAEVYGANQTDLGAAMIVYGTSNGMAPVDAGTYSVTASYAGAALYPAESVTSTITITQATPTIALSPLAVTFDGNSHGVTAPSVIGVNGAIGSATILYSSGGAPVHAVRLHRHRHVCRQPGLHQRHGHDDHHHRPGGADYRAEPGQRHLRRQLARHDGGSVGAGGVGGVDLGPATISYSSGRAPMHAGVYTVTGAFSGNGDYTSASVTKTITIAQATPTITLNPVTATYDSNPHGVTASVTGVNSTNLGSATITYSTSDGSVPVNAGAYTATATYVSSNPDYTGATATTTIRIYPQTSKSIIALFPATATYTGQGIAASAEVYGAAGADLGPAMIYYSLNGVFLATGVKPVNPGVYTVTAYYAGSTGYSTVTATATLTIGKATPTFALSPVSVTYDGNAHPVSTDAFGVNSTDLGAAQITYSSGAAPVAVGVYTSTATIAAAGNYTSATATTTITITPATPTITLNPSSVTYDGNTHVVTASVTGVNSANLGAATISYSLNGVPLAPGRLPTDAGVYTVTASFPGAANYTGVSVLSTLTITQATPTLSLSPIDVNYDGNAHGVSAEVYGVNGADLGPAAITYSGATSAPATAGAYTATAAFAGNQDYTAAKATTTILIFPPVDPITPLIALFATTATYTGQGITASAEVYGGNGADLGPATIAYSMPGTPGTPATPLASPPVDAGTYIVTATYAGSIGYTTATATSTITITPATPTIALLR